MTGKRCLNLNRKKKSENGHYFRFTIGFEEARNYRKEQGQYLRENAYEPLTVEVFI